MSAELETVSSDDEATLRVAKEVLQREIEGLESLSEVLGDEFLGAVQCIANLKGRVIVSGMGKSGHIARKIAATMASTGTPASFVHPGEASHGDLGMITKEDAILLLSNSGETEELGDIIAYSKRFSIPLIGMVRRDQSTLSEASDYPLVLPEVPEASPTGAPTTSTTMMLAYGDAIAVALIELRGFTKEDFNVYHPGGKLGQAFLKVEALMHDASNLPIVSEDELMEKTLLEITAKHFGCAGVIKADGSLAGIITDGDLRRHMKDDILAKRAGEVMTKDPVTIRRSMLAAEALGIMNNKSITSLFVLDADSKPVGILHIHDCLRVGIM
ncbi:MAG: KpsF/GutQ family sugar-phosphate isomerase [Rickettsiales bacterium]|nr:KpsF/GutQ family sugar-phosphate isomerase [Rickettsiales bacterium]